MNPTSGSEWLFAFWPLLIIAALVFADKYWLEPMRDDRAKSFARDIGFTTFSLHRRTIPWSAYFRLSGDVTLQSTMYEAIGAADGGTIRHALICATWSPFKGVRVMLIDDRTERI